MKAHYSCFHVTYKCWAQHWRCVLSNNTIIKDFLWSLGEVQNSQTETEKHIIFTHIASPNPNPLRTTVWVTYFHHRLHMSLATLLQLKVSVEGVTRSEPTASPLSTWAQFSHAQSDLPPYLQRPSSSVTTSPVSSRQQSSRHAAYRLRELVPPLVLQPWSVQVWASEHPTTRKLQDAGATLAADEDDDGFRSLSRLNLNESADGTTAEPCFAVVYLGPNQQPSWIFCAWVNEGYRLFIFHVLPHRRHRWSHDLVHFKA